MLKHIFRFLVKILPDTMRKAIIREAGGTLSSEDLGDCMRQLAQARSESLAPADALRFLFRLDGLLYALQGRHSVRYGNGVHSKKRHTKYHDFFINRIKKSEQVLDVGCGSGLLAFELGEKVGGEVLAIDLNPENIAQARQRSELANVEYRVGDILEYADDKPFDVVILSNVLEHLPDRVEFLRRLITVTGTERLLLRVPLFERDWRVPLKKELRVEWRLDPTHETEYSQESFSRELTAAGLTIAYQETRWGEIWAEAVPVLPK